MSTFNSVFLHTVKPDFSNVIRIHYRIYAHRTYIGVVFSLTGSLSFDRFDFYLYFLMILKETLTFLSLSNPVPQYWSTLYILCAELMYLLLVSISNASATLWGFVG